MLKNIALYNAVIYQHKKEDMKKLYRTTKVQKKTLPLIMFEKITEIIEKSNLPQEQIIVGNQTIILSKTTTLLSKLTLDLLKQISTPKATLYYVEYS